MEQKPESQNLRDTILETIPSLRAFARSMCWSADRADDLVQETLTRAFEKLDTFEAGSNLKAWLCVILRNVYYSEQRKRRREVADPDGLAAGGLATKADQNDRMDLQDFLLALQQLPAHQREAVILVGAEGLSYDEAAQICGCSAGTIKSRLSRARERLSVILGERPVRQSEERLREAEGEAGPRPERRQRESRVSRNPDSGSIEANRHFQ